ncbi:MAG: hypothetical protein OXG39_11095 [Chloroflexi bacterium]|nr:hypothetical protein [Chloroflexota bacterium]
MKRVATPEERTKTLNRELLKHETHGKGIESQIKSQIILSAKVLLVFMVPFLFSMPTSSQTDNCCSVDRQCDTDEQWIRGYWAFQNNQCAAPSQQQSSSTQTQSQPAPPAPADKIDNCCFVDRQCTTDAEWINGYNAFQNNLCAAPSQQPQSTAASTQGQTGASQDVDNCCFIGWQCSTNSEWTSGYWAFQHNQCGAAPSQWQEQWSQIQRQQQQPSSSARTPVERIHNPYTGETRFIYEDGVEIITRRPTQEEFCEALKKLELPLPPECEEE